MLTHPQFSEHGASRPVRPPRPRFQSDHRLSATRLGQRGGIALVALATTKFQTPWRFQPMSMRVPPPRAEPSTIPTRGEGTVIRARIRRTGNVGGSHPALARRLVRCRSNKAHTHETRSRAMTRMPGEPAVEAFHVALVGRSGMRHRIQLRCSPWNHTNSSAACVAAVRFARRRFAREPFRLPNYYSESGEFASMSR